MSEEIYLSVVIPAFNESKRIGHTLDTITAFLRGLGKASEVIVADDGSTDDTVALVRARLRNFPHKVLTVPKNVGKGDAVRRGMLSAQGKYVLFSDADLSTPIEEVVRFIQHHEQGWDVVIGSRALSHSKITVRQNLLREAMGRTFNLLARIFAFKGIQDSQCGFKSFTAAASRDLFTRQKLNGFGFDVEIIYLAQRLKYRVLEEAVTWCNSEQSRVRILSDPIKMFWEIFQIRMLHRK